MPFWVIANWKMNLTWDKAQELMQGYRSLKTPHPLIVCPPYPWLMSLHTMIQDSPHVSLGAQDCHTHERGAFTGGVSAAMIRECGCSYVLIGHSERRLYAGDTETILNAKIARALDAELTPILCVGEQTPEEEPEALKAQLNILENTSATTPLMIAYEPVWAIGTGRTPTPDEITHKLNLLRSWFRDHHRPVPPLLYGGSVNTTNAASFQAVCDGLLVGGASLDLPPFRALVCSLI